MLRRYNQSDTLLLASKVTQPASVSGPAVTTECVFNGLIIKTDGINDVTINVYDNDEASGNRILPSDIVILGAVGLCSIGFNPGIDVRNGVFVSIGVAGYGAFEYQVLYDDGI